MSVETPIHRCSVEDGGRAEAGDLPESTISTVSSEGENGAAGEMPRVALATQVSALRLHLSEPRHFSNVADP